MHSTSDRIGLDSDRTVWLEIKCLGTLGIPDPVIDLESNEMRCRTVVKLGKKFACQITISVSPQVLKWSRSFLVLFIVLIISRFKNWRYPFNHDKLYCRLQFRIHWRWSSAWVVIYTNHPEHEGVSLSCPYVQWSSATSNFVTFVRLSFCLGYWQVNMHYKRVTK